MNEELTPLKPADTCSIDTPRAQVRDTVRQIVSDHGRLGARAEGLTDTSDLYAAGLTSLATVGLMLALEEAFNIEFPDAALSRRTFGSIESLAAAVEKLRAS